MIAPHSALAPAGVQSTHISELFWGYFDVTALVFILVIGALVTALVRKPRPGEPPKTEPSDDALRPKRRAVGTATALTVITLVVLLVLSVVTGRALASLSTENAVQIKVVGHRWWWEVWYPDAAQASNTFRTAYEIHVPVGRPVILELESTDVIHSFWVPSLHGKRDLIPGKKTTFVFRTDQPGRYEGMCAEYCGTQHANMRFVVVAEPQADYDAWLAHSRQPAPAPTNEREQRGLEVFRTNKCAVCHAIGGTDAFGTVGPDLTHVASRHALAMGTIGNDRGHLAGWIVDPQGTKPGVIMPGSPLPPDDLDALLTYLGSLK
jgi:cytochrome c oxidase subunit 2